MKFSNAFWYVRTDANLPRRIDLLFGSDEIDVEMSDGRIGPRCSEILFFEEYPEAAIIHIRHILGDIAEVNYRTGKVEFAADAHREVETCLVRGILGVRFIDPSHGSVFRPLDEFNDEPLRRPSVTSEFWRLGLRPHGKSLLVQQTS